MAPSPPTRTTPSSETSAIRTDTSRNHCPGLFLQTEFHERLDRTFDNQWINVDRAADPNFFVRFLDASRARALEFARANPQLAFGHLALEPGLSLLDCGCGTGDHLGLLAPMLAPGQALGGDLSETMVQEARRRAAGIPNLRFETLDVLNMSYPDGTFDRVTANQLLIHVPEPRKGFEEMLRVLKPGGIVAISDMDWDSISLATDDRELGRKFARLFSDGVRNGHVVREYQGWLRAASFEAIAIRPIGLILEPWSFVDEFILTPSLAQLRHSGQMSEAEIDALLADLAQRRAEGREWLTMTYYTISARKPE